MFLNNTSKELLPTKYRLFTNMVWPIMFKLRTVFLQWSFNSPYDCKGKRSFRHLTKPLSHWTDFQSNTSCVHNIMKVMLKVMSILKSQRNARHYYSAQHMTTSSVCCLASEWKSHHLAPSCGHISLRENGWQRYVSAICSDGISSWRRYSPHRIFTQLQHAYEDTHVGTSSVRQW